MVLDATLTNPQSDDAARTFASYMGGKYGHNRTATEAAPARVAQILGLLNARLAQQQAAGRKFFIGDRLSALDIYWSTFAVMIQPLPPDLCPIPEPLRASFTNTNPVVAAAATPALLAHRDFIYREYLELPMDL
jgi:glutathione S-transferase